MVRHRPSLGLGLALVGLALFVLSLTALPWISANGEDVTLPDIHDALEGNGPAPAVPSTGTLPPQPGDLSGFRAAPAAPAQTATDGDYGYLETYSGGLWALVAAWLAVAAVFSTLVVPASQGARGLLGFLMSGLLGLAVCLVDDEGTIGPRVAAAFTVIVASWLHAAAVNQVFQGDGGPDPAYGVWASAAGLVLLFVGCLIGTRQERVPEGA
jgi:hypothetical protein